MNLSYWLKNFDEIGSTGPRVCKCSFVQTRYDTGIRNVGGKTTVRENGSGQRKICPHCEHQNSHMNPHVFNACVKHVCTTAFLLEFTRHQSAILKRKNANSL